MNAENNDSGSEVVTDVVTDETTNVEDQTVNDEGQDNTETSNDETDVDNADESEGKSEEEGKDEAIEYDFKMPEGLELDEAMANKFTDVAKDLNLDNEQANKIVALYSEKMMEEQQSRTDAWQKQVSDWEGELKSDPDFGGAKFAENAEIAKIAVNKFGGDELKEALNTTGLGNHPALVKFMYKVGSAMSEDSFNVESSNGNSQQATAQSLYSNSKMNPQKEVKYGDSRQQLAVHH